MKRLFIFLGLILFTTGLSAQDEEWDNYFMPGLGWKVYVPKQDTMGVYQGVITEFVFYARAKGVGSNRGGPARVRTYGNLSIMKSDKQNSGDIFFSNLGLNLSFEGNTDRKFLIPSFGVEIGGLYKRNFSTFHFTPLIGVQLISSQKIIWSVNGGYQYTTRLFDDYSGYTGSTTLNLLLWE
jgi:hypothetical protein